jgi:hypothetical protein
MIRVVNICLSIVGISGVMACCCPCGPAFRGGPPINVNVPPPVINPPPINPPPINQPVGDPFEEAIKKSGGTVVRDFGQPGNPVVEISYNFTKVKDADLTNLAPFPSLRKLTLTQNEGLNGSGLIHVTAHGSLQHLDLFQSRNVSDEAMRHAANFQQLKFLKITNTKIGDAGLREIAKLKNLEDLQASGLNEPTEAGLMQLGQLQKLRTLDLGNSAVADNCVKAFASLGQLKTLTLNGTRITDAGALNFAKMQQLEDLVLGRTVSNKTVFELRKLMPKTRISQR